MREILFRGKRTDNSEWIEGYYCNLGGNHPRVLKENIFIGKIGRVLEFKNIDVIPETVGQYTGLTDKNGVKIFEGDIVKAFIRYGTQHTKAITHRSGVFWFGNWNWVEFIDRFQFAEVIGNIYDNPELLKGGIDNG